MVCKVVKERLRSISCLEEQGGRGEESVRRGILEVHLCQKYGVNLKLKDSSESVSISVCTLFLNCELQTISAIIELI